MKPRRCDKHLAEHCRDVHLKELLDDYKFFAGLAVHWVFVGPSGRRSRPAAGGVLRSYRHCSGVADAAIKTIANSFYVANIARHPHSVEFQCAALRPRTLKSPLLRKHLSSGGEKTTPSSRASHGHCLTCRGLANPVNEQREAIAHWHPECLMYARAQRDHDRVPECLPVPGSTAEWPSVERVALFHYVTRSEEDFARKMERGGGQNAEPKPWSYFHDIAKCAVPLTGSDRACCTPCADAKGAMVCSETTHKGGLCSEIQRAVKRCCPEESFVL